MKYFTILLILICLCGCHITIRHYTPTIIAFDESTVNFPVEILAEVSDSGSKSEVKTDLRVRGSFVPGAFGM